MGKKHCLVLVWGLLTGPALAQPDETPRGRFLRPATHVGEVVEYELRHTHNPGLEVIFPDSVADFSPFEYLGQQYYPTRTRQGRSLDRTVYRLRTFSLDSVQQLRLPITVLRGRDTLTLLSAPAAVRLLYTAPKTVPTTLPALRQTTTLVPIDDRFNYPYWLAGLSGLLLLGGGLVLAFRRALRRRYQRYKLRKNHAYFLAQYARHIERFELSRSTTNMERAITLWKNYLTLLENNNLNTLTTREIEGLYNHAPSVSTALRIADQVIYGHMLTEDTQEINRAFDLLRHFAEERYQKATQRGVLDSAVYQAG
ncbi:hypothetical protein [Hymenobacter sp. BT730]|uniref:hypothetical protein n=1 Tax=Hymenobacter sp. BT730 TaxID=3063332 RepID=UPI0026E03299|nr:hypothetical protein [Hymenobacter sp. BT730]